MAKRKINKLHEWDKNPRSIKKKDFERLKKQIVKFGQYKPLLVTPDGEVLGGNMRLKAYRELGIDDVWVSVVKPKDENEKLEYALSDNDRAGYYDSDMLANMMPDYEIEWGDYAVDLKDPVTLDDLVPQEVEEDEVPEVEEGEPDSKLGEVYELGRHRLMCGDATKIEDVEKLMDGQKADMILTDPPYGIEYEYNQYNDTRENWENLMNDVVPLMRKISPFTVMPSCGIDRMEWWYKNHKPDWLIAWYKGSPGHLSKIGFNDWEALVVWGKPYKQMHDYFQTEGGFRDSDEHTCPKPVAWSSWLMQRGVDKDGLVLDLFGGSGSTLIACEQTNRICYMMELDPKYCDIIRKRYENQKKGRSAN